ncbi:ATP-binding protein [Candidatus Saccharibacteria bacterium]|nr:ATP-binding protein [Candidatus Saccharibacteria bacterium]
MDYKEPRGGQENILPDAAGLFYALRSMGYENTAAVADLIDNSIDAEANNIWISVDEDLNKIFIADDGVGMSEDTLHDAIRLGGKKAHDGASDLGKYGLGLITASISMGRVIRIITKKDGAYNTAVLDYDAIRQTNLFNADFHKSTDTEIASFNFRTNNSKSGTVLAIDKCDKLQYTRAKDLISAVDEYVGEAFRAFLKSGKKIFINGSEVHLYDPLLTGFGTAIVDTDIDIKSKSGIEGKMHVLAVKIPDQGPKANKALRLNIKGQGFYILRNRREVAAALEFPEIFKKHNDFNLLRIELGFNSDLDDLMGVNLKKHDIAPSNEIIDALKVVLDEPVKKVREEMKEKQRRTQDDNPFILSQTPKKPGKTVLTPTKKEKEIEVPVPNDESAKELKFEIVFSNYAGDEKGPLFKHTIQGEKITVLYNTCSEYYYEKMPADGSSTKTKEVLDDIIKASIMSYIRQSDALSSIGPFLEEVSNAFSKTE